MLGQGLHAKWKAAQGIIFGKWAMVKLGLFISIKLLSILTIFIATPGVRQQDIKRRLPGVFDHK